MQIIIIIISIYNVFLGIGKKFNSVSNYLNAYIVPNSLESLSYEFLIISITNEEINITTITIFFLLVK